MRNFEGIFRIFKDTSALWLTEIKIVLSTLWFMKHFNLLPKVWPYFSIKKNVTSVDMSHISRGTNKDFWNTQQSS